MEILEAVRSDFVTAELPEDVREVMEMLGGHAPPAAVVDRRRSERVPHHVRAAMEIDDALQHTRQTIYTRDVSSWGVGFISRVPLPTGANAMLHIAGVHGRTLQVMCSVIRCREVLPGWYEGAAVLFKEEPMLSSTATSGRAS